MYKLFKQLEPDLNQPKNNVISLHKIQKYYIFKSNNTVPINLTEKQWQVIKKILEPQERKRKHSPKKTMNAALYINKTSYLWLILLSIHGRPFFLE